MSLLDPREPEGPLTQKWDRFRKEMALLSPKNKRKVRVVVVGAGLAGGSAAATLGELGYNVDCFCHHDSPRRAHSVAAQGGINAAKNYQYDGDSVWNLYYDTIKGGDFRSRESNVYRLSQISAQIIDQCVAQGVPFARDYGGMLVNRSFGGAKVSRTFYCRGQTGQQLLLGCYQALQRQVQKGSVTMHNNEEMMDLVLIDGQAKGIVTRNLRTGEIRSWHGDVVVLATGGYSNVFYRSTNAVNCNVGAAWRCHRRGALFANPCYTQIHPTCIPFSSEHQSKLTLMSESPWRGQRRGVRVRGPSIRESCPLSGTYRRTPFERALASLNWRNAFLPDPTQLELLPMTATASPPEALPSGVRLTALDPEFRENPYPLLARLRTEDPVHHDTELQRYVFTRHDDVYEILRHPDYWSDPRRGRKGSFAREFLIRGDEDQEPSMLLMDDPGHRRLRELVRHPFSPRAVERWRERAREVARRHVTAIEGEDFDLIDLVANPVPTVVIAELLGIDPDNHAQFKIWSDTAIRTAFSPIQDPAALKATEAAMAGLDEYFRHEIERRRGEPGDDLVSDMVRAEEAGDRLSDDEIVSQCNLLLLAGNLTTSDLIGNAVMALLRNPGELEKLRARPELMKNTVEEVLRFDSPVTNSGRIAHEDIVIRGVEIRQGESLAVSLAGANRDPAAHPDPDRFDIERQNIHLQSFGGGRHFCLGAHLARLECAETLAALLDRFPTLSLGDGGHRYAANPSFRGLETLWLRGEGQPAG